MRLVFISLALFASGCFLNRAVQPIGDGSTPPDGAWRADAFAPRDAGTDAGPPPPEPFIGALAAGAGFSCALRIDGIVLCWGEDDNGQLGDGFVGADRPLPEPVDLP